MHCRFDVLKAVQSAAVLLRRERKRMTRLRLLKLLIIADRRSIQEMGRPILGSRVVAMDNGPLHSAIYDLIKGEHPAQAVWSKFIMTDGPLFVQLIDEPDVSQLSRPEIALLTQVSEELADQDDYTLSQMTHEFPEFKKRHVKGTSREISLEDIIEGVGRGADKAAILEDLRDDDAFERFFSRLRA